MVVTSTLYSQKEPNAIGWLAIGMSRHPEKKYDGDWIEESKTSDRILLSRRPSETGQ